MRYIHTRGLDLMYTSYIFTISYTTSILLKWRTLKKKNWCVQVTVGCHRGWSMHYSSCGMGHELAFGDIIALDKSCVLGGGWGVCVWYLWGTFLRALQGTIGWFLCWITLRRVCIIILHWAICMEFHGQVRVMCGQETPGALLHTPVWGGTYVHTVSNKETVILGRTCDFLLQV